MPKDSDKKSKSSSKAVSKAESTCSYASHGSSSQSRCLSFTELNEPCPIEGYSESTHRTKPQDNLSLDLHSIGLSTISFAPEPCTSITSDSGTHMVKIEPSPRTPSSESNILTASSTSTALSMDSDISSIPFPSLKPLYTYLIDNKLRIDCSLVDGDQSAIEEIVDHEWVQLNDPPKPGLMKIVRRMIENLEKPNLKIRIGTVVFKCHLIVLQCYSAYFREFRRKRSFKLPEKTVTREAFVAVYNWMLTEKPGLPCNGICEVFMVANFLRTDLLINHCWSCFDENFREDKAFLFSVEANLYGLDNIKKLMLARVSKFFLSVVASRDFLLFNIEELCYLLQSNAIAVNTELEVFMAIIHWLNHSWNDRKPNLVDAIRCVRFGLIPSWMLVVLGKGGDSELVTRVIHHPDVVKMISDGISFDTTNRLYCEDPKKLTDILHSYNVVPPIPRQWIFDRNCSYHHTHECPKKHLVSVTFDLFLGYLAVIHTGGNKYYHNLLVSKQVDNLECCKLEDDEPIPRKRGASATFIN